LVFSLFTFLIFIAASGFDAGAMAQNPGASYAFIIGGLGGEPKYSEKFGKLLLGTHKALVGQFGFSPDNIIVFAEREPDEEDFINGVSTAENIRAEFERLSGLLTENDYLYVILIGHGSYDGKNARLNIPRRDLSDDDYAGMIDEIHPGRIIFINTASSSFPFISRLSAPGRIIITATKSPTQRNITVFPDFFIEGFTDAAADTDKNGDLSLLEVFTHAALKTERFYEDGGHLATEHAMLEDTGDAQAFRVHELEENGEGSLAAVTYLRRRVAEIAGMSDSAADSAIIRLFAEREKVELDISQLKNRKGELTEAEYFEMLESLLIRLARIEEAIEKRQKIR